MKAIHAAFYWACFVAVVGMFVGLYGANVDSMAWVVAGIGTMTSGAVTMILLAFGLQRL